MADDVKTLAKFTPTAVNRDALLFHAGRASVPGRRPWQIATTLLCVTQGVTLAVWLWPRTPAVPTPVPPAPPITPAEWQEPPPPSSYLALRARLGEPWHAPAVVSDSEPPPPSKPFGVRSSLD